MLDLAPAHRFIAIADFWIPEAGINDK